MASSNIKTRRSCSCIHILIAFFSFILFILSTASLAPTIALKTPPSLLGYAFLLISFISILSSIIGFYSQINHFCYTTHISLLLSSSAGQLLGFLLLFTKEKSSISMFRSPRDPREAKFLVRVECVVLLAMFVMQLGVLVLCYAAHRSSVREYDGGEKPAEL